jgi:hypothetical protein
MVRVVVIVEARLIMCSQTVVSPVLLKVMCVVRVIDYVATAISAWYIAGVRGGCIRDQAA